MHSRTGFLRAYLIIALLMGFLGLLDNIFALVNVTPALYQDIVVTILFLFFFFNLYSIIIFRRHKVERIAYVLPIYHLLSYALFVSFGITVIFVAATPEWLATALIGLGFASSLFEIVFSAYLLTKLDFSPSLPH